jgi:thioredoxin 1
MTMLSFSAQDFEGTRLRDSRNVLAVFYASWCPFCRSFLDLFETAMANTIDPLGARVDISDDENPLWEGFGLEIVPTLIGFRDGMSIVRKDGSAGVGLGMLELEAALGKMRGPRSLVHGQTAGTWLQPNKPAGPARHISSLQKF